jgi:dTDP-4-amino-4,6-dideoxygalactose transaminase
VDDVANARLWAAEELSLPMAPELTDEEITRLCAAVVGFAARV